MRGAGTSGSKLEPSVVHNYQPCQILQTVTKNFDIRILTCQGLSLCKILALLLAPADVQEVEDVLEDGGVGLAVVQAGGLDGAGHDLFKVEI